MKTGSSQIQSGDNRKTYKKIRCYLFIPATLALLQLNSCTNNPATHTPTLAADADNVGLVLPTGFAALKVADSTGNARHIAVNKNGDIFIKLEEPRQGKGIVVLTDKDGDGRADGRSSFADYGGTGIAIKNDFLYASSNTTVFRYKLDAKQQVTDPLHPDTLVSGLIDRGQHNSKSLTLDNNGNIYVNIGAYSNACQEKDRTKGSPGMQPCPILDSAGGIWQFKADAMHQGYGTGKRYATGLRNVVGLDWNQQTNALYVMQHGRDNLHDFFPELYDVKQAAELPAETMYKLSEGSDCGWPYIYYDQFQEKKMVMPEYGGDGKKEVTDKYENPVATFPGHLAPNGLLFYTGDMFPEHYKNGAFIAFHGSWNRAPEPQAGFMVAFVPFQNGVPSGKWEVFAKGFAGRENIAAPGDAAHRPCGLAQGPDGSLYVSDDKMGTIYRITYKK
ncbi:PQQ-dependent sugar dehydrogenase [Chitinophaga sp. MM2321]|uniref:PQQ-dependent sugar dehydrogenase n=1 Tax=Chitinophaga sp. MM2321 TaxID=3137178 RepID=UPI0032D5831D